MFYFTTRKARATLQQQGKRVIDVSSRAPLPYCYLSLFYPHGNIPIPGMPGKTADAVEGIWQGLKVFQGHIDESYFRGRGKKRRGKPEGHRYEGKVIDYLQARQLIYVPSYHWMVYHAPHVLGTALMLLEEGWYQDLFFHDFETNPRIDDLSRPLAHAAVLVELLNENLNVLVCYYADPTFRRAYEEADGGTQSVLADALIKEHRLKVHLLGAMKPRPSPVGTARST
jgi:hypothetical protein